MSAGRGWAASAATRLRRVPWGWIIAAVLAVALVITWLLQWRIGFKDSKLDEWAALTGALLLAWPGLSLNAAARRRSLLDDEIAKLWNTRGPALTPEQSNALEADILRLVSKTSRERNRSLDWSLGAELFLLAGYVAFLVASFGNLLYS